MTEGGIGDPLPPVLRRGSMLLVVSDQWHTLMSARVRTPFEALVDRGALEGYALVERGSVALAYGRSCGSVGAVWVQRADRPAQALLLDLLDAPFVYDIDDHLFAKPDHRSPADSEGRALALGMLRGAEVVSCSTPALASLVRAHASDVPARAFVVTPNLAPWRRLPQPNQMGAPRAIAWASSDAPALSTSRAAVVEALRRVCLRHRLPLVTIGVNPPSELCGSGVEVRSFGLLEHHEYLAALHALSPAILVGPLETEGTADGQRFVAGKSDIKVLEAAICGLTGVFSRASPYENSDITGANLCDNTLTAWEAALEAACVRCTRELPPPIPPGRDARLDGLAPWAECLARARLRHPIRLGSVTDAVMQVRDIVSPLLEQADFDEAAYLKHHGDVAEAIADGAFACGFEHYVRSGRAEGRPASPRGHASVALNWGRALSLLAALDRRTPA